MTPLDQQIIDVVSMFNVNSKWMRKTRVPEKYIHDTRAKKDFKKAFLILPTLKEWKMVIDEIDTMVRDDESGFWSSRKGKHGVDWLFVRRSKGEGEINYIYYYESALERKENEAEKEVRGEQFKDFLDFGEKVDEPKTVEQLFGDIEEI